ncbi:MAG: hypothetical protein WBN61_02710 [Woeseiaceae bacterium]
MVRYSTSGREFSSGNPIANALVIVIGALAIGASIVLGFFAFIVLASIVLIMASVIGIRVWWFNRKLQKATKKSAGQPQAGGVIEGEYHVIVEDRDEHR